MAVTRDGNKVYVANETSNTVSVIDTATNSVTATVAVGGVPIGGAATPDGSKVYVANFLGTVSVIATASNTVIATIQVGGAPFGVAATPDGSKVYVTNFNLSGSVSVVDTATNTVTATIPVGARTAIWVAMRNERQLLGYITAYRQEAKPFTEKQITLLQNFAAQAVIAMENARLITETREALEQQTATAEVLGVINSSPGDLTPVFDAILEKAHTLCGATLGTLRVIEGEYVRSVAQRGHSAGLADELRERAPLSDATVTKALVDGAPFAHILDIAELDHPAARRAAQAGVRTLLAVPLRKDNALLGAIFAGRQEVRPYTDKQIALLQNFAVQAVIAMENARLITETREALQQQTATAEVLGVINASPGDLGPVFEVMLDRAISLCEAAYGVLWTYSDEGFRAATLHGVPQRYAAHLAQEPIQLARGTNTALGQIADGSDFAHFEDVASEEGYMISGARRLIELGGARTVMVVALRKDGKLLGAISAFRQEVRPFTDKQIALLQNFAAQAVIAMENARLITETREALEQQTPHRLFEAVRARRLSSV